MKQRASLRVVVFVLLTFVMLVPSAGARAESGVVGTARAIVFWVPNRVFDVVDIVRARARVGPGFAIGVRATEAVDFYMGTYTSVYVGLPGPRSVAGIPLPAGLESRTGLEASIADASVDGPIGPDYGLMEVGAGTQLVLLGIDVGVDPFQLIDFALGLVFLDPADDDF